MRLFRAWLRGLPKVLGLLITAHLSARLVSRIFSGVWIFKNASEAFGAHVLATVALMLLVAVPIVIGSDR